MKKSCSSYAHARTWWIVHHWKTWQSPDSQNKGRKTTALSPRKLGMLDDVPIDFDYRVILLQTDCDGDRWWEPSFKTSNKVFTNTTLFFDSLHTGWSRWVAEKIIPLWPVWLSSYTELKTRLAEMPTILSRSFQSYGTTSAREFSNHVLFLYLVLYLFFSTMHWSCLYSGWVENSCHHTSSQKADSADVSNCRPISLLCSVSKVLERLIFNHVSDHIYPF